MSWEKDVGINRVIHYPGSMEVEKYVYTPGVHGLEFAKALKNGKILGMKCKDTVYVPPLTLCPDHSEGELVEVKGPWRVVTFTIVTKTMNGDPLEEPEILAVVKPDGVEGGIIHRIKAGKDIYIGMKVKPVFKREEERRGTINDILYFEPHSE
ncbi:MAG: Zn-ribbon domain-containing OB-fold protein [Desulfurococcales archaeon]|nr:Zn-ribbon domain-containing OB-fold protein [Desulfurococcales archaeon]